MFASAFSKMAIQNLPVELVEKILSFLTYYDVLRCKQINKQFKQLLVTFDIHNDTVPWIINVKKATMSRFKPTNPSGIFLFPFIFNGNKGDIHLIAPRFCNLWRAYQTYFITTLSNVDALVKNEFT